ncbi:MAG: carboxypeptidase-like regulatory domain-containing protein [Blastocatellia bacterium]
MFTRILAIAFAILGLAFSLALAQSPQGTISGTVTDAQGANVPNATITALRVKTNQNYTAVSSANGIYSMTSLPIGRALIIVSATHSGASAGAAGN